MRSGCLVAVVVAALAPAEGASPSAAAFARLAKLDGDWRGSLSWTGARTGRGPAAAHYHLSGGGSAVVEDLEMDSKIAMTSVYHLDGDDLRMTHYCAARNQPRLKATRIDEDGTIHFIFVDATNLASPDAPHVDGLDVRFQGDRQMTLVFTFRGGDKVSLETIALTRVSSDPAPDAARPSPR